MGMRKIDLMYHRESSIAVVHVYIGVKLLTFFKDNAGVEVLLIPWMDVHQSMNKENVKIHTHIYNLEICLKMVKISSHKLYITLNLDGHEKMH